MKNNKGFTLIELLASICILGIIITIGVISFNSIRKNIKEKEYDNLKEEIIIASKKYFSDSTYNRVDVDLLIKKGYIKSENDGLLYNPINNNILNCYQINRDEENLIEKYYNEDGVCENLLDDKTDYNFGYCLEENCENVLPIPDGFLGPDLLNNQSKFYLGINQSILNDLNIIDKITWSTDLDPGNEYIIKDMSSSNINSILVNINDNEIINTTYYLKIYYKDGTINENVIVLKVDYVKPVINCTIDSSSQNTEDGVTVNIECDDYESGCDSSSYQEINNEIKDIMDFYVKDNAGNQSSCNISVTSQKQKKTCKECNSKTVTTKVKSTCSRAGAGKECMDKYGTTRCTIKYTCYKNKSSTVTSCSDYGCKTWNSNWENTSSCSNSNSTQCRTIYNGEVD